MAHWRTPYQRPGRHQGPSTNENIFIQEISSLKALLSQEREKWIEENRKAGQLWQELQNTKAQLEKQKSLKEMFIKREKETRQNYERLQKYTDAETLSCANTAAQVQSASKQKQKKFLLKDYEELKVAHVTSLEKMSTELQMEKKRNLELQAQLTEAIRLYQDSIRYKTEVASVHEQAESSAMELQLRLSEEESKQDNPTKQIAPEFEIFTDSQEKENTLEEKLKQTKSTFSQLQAEQEVELRIFKEKRIALDHEFSREVQAWLESDTKHQEEIIPLKAEKTLRQKMAEEISTLQNSCSKSEKNIQSEPGQLKTQRENKTTKNKRPSKELREMDEFDSPKAKIARRSEPEQKIVYIPEILLTPDFHMDNFLEPVLK